MTSDIVIRQNGSSNTTAVDLLQRSWSQVKVHNHKKKNVAQEWVDKTSSYDFQYVHISYLQDSFPVQGTCCIGRLGMLFVSCGSSHTDHSPDIRTLYALHIDTTYCILVSTNYGHMTNSVAEYSLSRYCEIRCCRTWYNNIIILPVFIVTSYTILSINGCIYIWYLLCDVTKPSLHLHQQAQSKTTFNHTNAWWISAMKSP